MIDISIQSQLEEICGGIFKGLFSVIQVRDGCLQSNRDRQANLQEAFKGLVNSIPFKIWHNKKTQEILSGKTVEERVKEQMDERNLKVECRDESGKWTLYNNQPQEE